MRCKDCMYFILGGYWCREEYGGDAEIVLRYGDKQIRRRREEKDFGICVHDNVRSDINDSWFGREGVKLKDDSIMANCDEDRAALDVGKNFGCIYFKKG